MCSGNGRCDSPFLVCECAEGFYEGDCSKRWCPFGKAWSDRAVATDDAHNEAECSNMGLCDTTTGLCTCESGFEGPACDRKTCPTACNDHGECMSMAYYASQKDPGEGTVYDYSGSATDRDFVWDFDMMYGCDCDDGYWGPDCSLRHCPTGDDPLTGTVNDPDGVQVNEKQVVTCTATSGYFTLTFRGATTAQIAYDEDLATVTSYFTALATVNDATINFAGTTSTACTFTGNEITIEFTQDFGDVPLIVADDTNLAHSSTLFDPEVTVEVVNEGTKEDKYCSDRGICDTELGYCSCGDYFDTSDGYGGEGERGDCGYATVSVTSCPGEVSCSGQGVCEGPPTYACDCSNGWTGSDCSERTCPFGISWFSLPTADDEAHGTATEAECSDMGTCDRTEGECTCMDGFEGAACARLTCPGDGDCNGNGQCLTMSQLAEEADDNGDETDYTYGAIPNDPATWDFDSIQGCLCNDGYHGYDCSLMTCPYGDDVRTNDEDQVNEVQTVTCTGSSGTFYLDFRQSQTAEIAYDATATEVRTALEATTELEIVYVSNSAGSDAAVCSGSGTQFTVTFVTETGDVPLLQSTVDGVDSITVTETQKGTKEYIECGGRGLCDYTTGICRCFQGYGSSDGEGGSGDRGDCGYVEPIYENSNSESVNNA